MSLAALPLPVQRAAPLRWLGACLAREIAYGRFPLLLPLCLIAGIALAIASPVAPMAELLGAGAAILYAGRWLAARTARLSLLAPVLLALSAVALGAFAVSLQERVVATPTVARAVTATLTGQVVSVEDRGERGHRIVLKVETSDLEGPPPRRVRLSLRGGAAPTVGERLALKARLFPLRGPAMPGGFDSGRRLYFDGIGASGFAYGTPTRLSEASPTNLRKAIYEVRRAVETRVEAHLPERTAAFATALLVGFRGDLYEEDVEALRVAGLGHILAISGLHMALVAGSVFAAVRFGLALVPPLALRYPIRKWAAVIGLLAATVYLLLSGGAVATVRAYIMLVIALVAVLADRPALTMRTVSLAAVLVIAMDPISVLEPGFQMSFLAVVALVGAYEHWNVRRLALPVSVGRPVLYFVIGLAATSLIAGLATAPIAAFHFHRLAPMGLVGNLLAMPVMTLAAMPAGVVALAAMPLGLEGPALQFMGRGLEVILFAAHQVRGWTGDAGAVGALPALSAASIAIGIVWLSVMLSPLRLLGLVAIAAGVLTADAAPRPDVYVTADGEVVAVRAPDGALAISAKPDGFAAAVIVRADGTRAVSERVWSCDRVGCAIEGAGGWHAAAPMSPRAVVSDCRRAEVIVARFTMPPCEAALVVDRNALHERGAIAATRGAHGTWEVKVARPHGHTRAWQVSPQIDR